MPVSDPNRPNSDRPSSNWPSSNWIDLHSHTTASDGTYSPEELIAAASASGLSALAITDHDTFAGYHAAVPHAKAAKLDLVQGIELNSRLNDGDGEVRHAHILGYFIEAPPHPSFTDWLQSQRDNRTERNRNLVASLNKQGVEITLEEVEAVGKSLTGRPHFARVLVRRGYAKNADDAFRRYLGEEAPAYVERSSPSAADVISILRQGGGIPVLAHPVRLHLPHDLRERTVIAELKKAGLLGLEVQHSEQSAELQTYYLHMAHTLGLWPTGGSDFHGSIKPDVALGTGRDNNIRVPVAYLEQMRTQHVS